MLHKIIPATQEDEDYEFERDSVRSNSSRSTRIRLQEKFRVIDKKSADSLTPAGQKEWFRKHASKIMDQSGNSDDVDPADVEFGGFKRVQVRLYLYFIFRLNVFPLNSVYMRQCYQSMLQRAKGYRSEQYHCPYRFKCGC